MNQRIQQLEKQATEIVRCGLNGTSTAESFNRKKFAELIVRECIDIVHKETDDSVRVETAIQIHFGVEE